MVPNAQLIRENVDAQMHGVDLVLKYAPTEIVEGLVPKTYDAPADDIADVAASPFATVGKGVITAGQNNAFSPLAAMGGWPQTRATKNEPSTWGPLAVGDWCRVGPFAVIGPEVFIGRDTWIGPHAVINGPTRIGAGNRIYQFTSIGDAAQDKKYHGETSRLEIGDGNVIREYVSINRGTGHGGALTCIGDRNWIMA